MKGNLSVADGQDTSRAMTELLNQHEDTCVTTWAGFIQDDNIGGRYLDVNSGAEMKWSNWGNGQPQGGLQNKCVFINSETKMLTVPCFSKHCTQCNLK